MLPVAFFQLRRIIGLALVALALTGCSMVRLAYDQAPNLTYWWIDGYVDSSGEQTTRLRESVDRWYLWHARTQLPDYAALLARAQRDIVAPLTAGQVCAWVSQAERRIETALEAAVPATAELMLSLTPAQLQHIERRMAKGNEEMRADFLQADREERQAASLKRAVDRFERIYGRLDTAQRERLAALLAQSSFDPERWLGERRMRQRDILQTLKSVSLAAASADRAAAVQQAQAASRVLFERTLRSPRADYRAYQQRLVQDNCRLVATLHNAMTPVQREAARNKLKGWEDDLRVLAAGAAAGKAGETNDASSR